MAFLDPKEQVIDLQLTSYGRYLLSKGNFKPASYAFFDDDILYDKGATQSDKSAPSNELQNDIEIRIQDETPRLSAQTIYRGAQVGTISENPQHINNLMPGIVADKSEKRYSLVETPDSSYIFTYPIGNSAYNTKNIAAWDINFLKAPLNKALGYWVGKNDDVPTTFIPQLDCTLKFKMYLYPSDPNAPEKSNHPNKLTEIKQVYGQNVENNDGTRTPFVLKDDSYLVYVDDFAFLKIEEANTEFLKENFELEVFRIKQEAKTLTKKDESG